MQDPSELYTRGDIGPLTPPPLPPNCVYTKCYCEENIYLLAKTFIDEVDSTASQTWTSRWDVYVIFISNDVKTVALWNQKARDDVVVWDYHVILVLRPRLDCTEFSGGGEIPGIQPAAHSWVYDYDSRLPMPCSSKEYVLGTFPYASRPPYDIPERYVSLFRIVPARKYLDYFASDRSHMLVQGRTDAYTSAPPLYPPLCGSKAREMEISNNLMSCYVDMRVQRPSGTGAQQTEFEGRSSTAEARQAHVPRTPEDDYGEVLDMPGFLSWLDGSPSG